MSDHNTPRTPDPAGLDKLLLAAGKGIARWLERSIQVKCKAHVNIWDGPDGLGAVIEEHLKAAGIPNERLPALAPTPRQAVEALGFRPSRTRPVVRKAVRR